MITVKIFRNTDHIFFHGKVTIQSLHQLRSYSNKARLKSGKAKSTSQSSGFTDIFLSIFGQNKEHCKYSLANVTLESFENWTLCLARSRLYLSFVGLWKNCGNGQDVCQDDRVQVCLLSYLSKELPIFS